MKSAGRFVSGLKCSAQLLLIVQSLIFISLMTGCSESTDPVPTPGDLSFSFIPESTVNDFFIGENGDFSFNCSPSVSLEIQWTLNGAQVSQEPLFHYEANHVGVDTVQVEYSYSSVSWIHTWFADVQQNSTTAPGDIPWVILEHGPEPADVLVRWHAIPESTITSGNGTIWSEYTNPSMYQGELIK